MAFFENGEAIEVEPGLTCVSRTSESSGRTRYVFFSKDVYGMRLRNARVRIRRMLNEARAMRDGEKPASSLVTVRVTIQDLS